MSPTDESVLAALRLAQGPLFRFALALTLLGLLRLALLSLSDAIAAYVSMPPGEFWRRVRLRALWGLLPALVLRRVGRLRAGGGLAYHVVLDAASLLLRTGAVLIPTFMVAHVYLWERALGASWPSFGGALADALTWTTLAAGVLVFLGRIYSSTLRAVEPAWSFLKPLFLLPPFVTGLLAAHPTWSPVDYHVMLLVHTLSAALAMILVPLAKLLSAMHTPITRVAPQASWRAAPAAALPAGAAGG